MTPMNSVARLEDVYPRADERVYAKWVRLGYVIEYIALFQLYLGESA